jgi:hypothetical protein
MQPAGSIRQASLPGKARPLVAQLLRPQGLLLVRHVQMLQKPGLQAQEPRMILVTMLFQLSINAVDDHDVIQHTIIVT